MDAKYTSPSPWASSSITVVINKACHILRENESLVISTHRNWNKVLNGKSLKAHSQFYRILIWPLRYRCNCFGKLKLTSCHYRWLHGSRLILSPTFTPFHTFDSLWGGLRMRLQSCGNIMRKLQFCERKLLSWLLSFRSRVWPDFFCKMAKQIYYIV